VANAVELGKTVEMLLADPAQAAAMGARAQQVVQNEQGATARHAQVILEALDMLKRAGHSPNAG
jgi:hypothetical protein